MGFDHGRKGHAGRLGSAAGGAGSGGAPAPRGGGGGRRFPVGEGSAAAPEGIDLGVYDEV
jgi:hypothetical protein